MIVDDEQELVTLFSSMLKQSGYHVSGFTNPIEAFEDFRRNYDRYALVLSDVRMPEMGGFEFARKVKSVSDEVKVILISAFEIRKQEFDMMFPTTKIDEIIEKPISVSKLTQIASKYAGTVQPH